MTRSPLGAPPWRPASAHSRVSGNPGLGPRFRGDERKEAYATPPLRLRIISGNALNERGFCFSSIHTLRSQQRSYYVVTKYADKIPGPFFCRAHSNASGKLGLLPPPLWGRGWGGG